MQSSFNVLQNALELGIRQAVRLLDLYIIEAKQPDRERGANAVRKQ